MDGEKTRGKILAANDIQHAEHVICMMTTGNFNEAFVFFFPENRCGLGSGRNEQSSACLYSATDYSSATSFEYAILRLKDKKKTLLRQPRAINEPVRMNQCWMLPCFSLFLLP